MYVLSVEDNPMLKTHELFTVPDTTAQLARFDQTDEAIAVLAEQYMPLTINGIDDADGFAIVHKARMDIKGRRVAVERVRKELKADALEYGRKVDAEAKRLTALLEPIEEHLAAEENAVTAEKERLRNEARLKAEAEERAKREAEEARLRAEREAEAERLRVEREKLEAERRAMEEERRRMESEAQARAEEEAAKQREAQEKIEAERRAIEAEKARLAEAEAARLREIEMKKRESEAAERARIETEHRLAQEAAAAKARAEAEELARKRAEALRPDREKLLSVAAAINKIEVPDVSDAAIGASEAVRDVLANAAHAIHVIVGDMPGGEGN